MITARHVDHEWASAADMRLARPSGRKGHPLLGSPGERSQKQKAMAGLARAFRSLVLSDPGSAERKVADAIRAYPDWTAGSTRPERMLMETMPGLLLESVAGRGVPDLSAGQTAIPQGR